MSEMSADLPADFPEEMLHLARRMVSRLVARSPGLRSYRDELVSAAHVALADALPRMVGVAEYREAYCVASMRNGIRRACKRIITRLEREVLIDPLVLSLDVPRDSVPDSWWEAIGKCVVDPSAGLEARDFLATIYAECDSDLQMFLDLRRDGYSLTEIDGLIGGYRGWASRRQEMVRELFQGRYDQWSLSV